MQIYVYQNKKTNICRFFMQFMFKKIIIKKRITELHSPATPPNNIYEKPICVKTLLNNIMKNS